jgi:hypothetical protein
VVVVCGTLLRRAHRRFSPELSGALADFDHPGSDKSVSSLYSGINFLMRPAPVSKTLLKCNLIKD